MQANAALISALSSQRKNRDILLTSAGTSFSMNRKRSLLFPGRSRPLWKIAGNESRGRSNEEEDGLAGQDEARRNDRIDSFRVHVCLLYPADPWELVRPSRRLDSAACRVHQLHDLGDVWFLQAAARLADRHRQLPGHRLWPDHRIDCTLLRSSAEGRILSIGEGEVRK